jgi:hypothetical protein
MTDRQLLTAIATRLSSLEGMIASAGPTLEAIRRYEAKVPLTTKDVALLLGISRRGVVAAVEKGRLKKRGGSFDSADVAAYMHDRRSHAHPAIPAAGDTAGVDERVHVPAPTADA